MGAAPGYPIILTFGERSIPRGDKMFKWTSVPSLAARLMLLFLCAAAYAQTSAVPSGSGTSADPYQIDSLPNLYWLLQTSSIWNDGLYFEQTSDIDASETSGWNSDSGWSPIGNTSIKFTGSFNGKGHVITGLYINRPYTNYMGLFGYTNGANIDSLGLEDCDITGYRYVGGLVGYNKASSVGYSHVTGSISGTKSFIGGLVGSNIHYSTVSNSYATATQQATSRGLLMSEGSWG